MSPMLQNCIAAVVLVLGVLPSRPRAADEPVAITPFKVHVEESVLTDLRERLAKTRWPDQIPESGWQHGPDVASIKALCEYWRTGFDWRAQEARLNQWPQFITRIDGLDLHFLHVRSKHEQATPLVLVHGWPSSFVEFIYLLPMLTEPENHGGTAEDAFHVVIPSLPGFGFSSKPREAGWSGPRMAEVIAKLMARLGYERYGAQGGDWGGGIVRWLAANDERCLGAHSNFPPMGRGGQPTPDEAQRAQKRIAELADHKAYAAIQGTRPLALGYGLNDSPAGLAAWIVDKFWAWSDHNGDLERSFRRDDLLTNITLYWVTETMPSSVRIYFESSHDAPRPATMTPFASRKSPPAPLGFALFPKEINLPARSAVEQSVPNVIHWTEFARGGHFAALEQPEALARDIRRFFTKVKERETP